MMLKKFSRLIILISLISTSLLADRWDSILKKGKVVVGIKQNAPPFSVQNEDGEFWGFEIDLLRAMVESWGVELVLKPIEAKQRIPLLLQNKVDLVMATMTHTRKREGVVDFSIPYFQVGQGLMAHADSQIQSLSDVDGKKVAYVSGTQAYRTLSKFHSGCSPVPAKSYADAIQKVLNKEADALCSDYLILLGLFQQSDKKDQLTVLSDTIAPEPYAIAIKENESQLRDMVNHGLMELWESGAWHDAYDTWFGEGSAYFHELFFRINVIPR